MRTGSGAWSALAFAVVLAASGCDADRKDGEAREGGASDVVVDFYRDGEPSAACAGALLSSSVVLTAAHCADASDGARVTVAGDASRSADVARVLPYDWTDDVGHHAEEHDLVVLVLRRPLAAPAYARLSTDDAFGHVVSVSRRSRDGVRFGIDVQRIDGVKLSTERVAALPFAALVSVPVLEAGGAVRRGDGAVVGIVIGRGADTGAGYVASVNDPLIATWIELVTAAARSPAAGDGAIHPATLVDGTSEVVGAGGSTGSLVSSAPPEARSAAGTPLLGSTGPVPLTYDPATLLLTGDPTGYVVRTGRNYWAAVTPDLIVGFYHASTFASSQPSTAFIMAHGGPGWMEGVPPPSELARLVRSDRPTLLISCYGGAMYRGSSNAARIAGAAGVAPQLVWGCTGLVVAQDDRLDCAGLWVDGTGQPVPRK